MACSLRVGSEEMPPINPPMLMHVCPHSYDKPDFELSFLFLCMQTRRHKKTMSENSFSIFSSSRKRQSTADKNTQFTRIRAHSMRLDESFRMSPYTSKSAEKQNSIIGGVHIL